MSRALKLFVVAMLVGWSFAAAPVGVAATQSEAAIEVVVVDSDGDGVGGVTVTATWDGGNDTRQTASNGRAFVNVEEGATVEFNVTGEEYVRNHPLVVEDVGEGEEVEVDVARKGRSTVVVSNTAGEPIEGATVEFKKGRFRTDARGTTDGDGRFETGTVEQGVYEVTIRKAGFLELVNDSVVVGGDSRHEFTLERGTAQLEVSVVDDHFDDPQPLDEARVTIEDDQGEVAALRVSGGTASTSVPVNNEYAVTVEREGYQRAGRTVDVGESDERVELSTQRVPTLTVEPQNSRVVVGETTAVTVVNAYDEPVADAEVIKNNRTVGETDAEGELTVTIESTGSQGIRASRGDLESAVVTVEGVEPAEGESAAAPTPTGSGTVDDGAGFGAAVALVALAGAALLARRH